MVVSFFQLNRLEDRNVPKGSYELDTAVLPSNLLKVITNNETVEKRASKLHGIGRRFQDRYLNRVANEGGQVEHDKPCVYKLEERNLQLMNNDNPSKS